MALVPPFSSGWISNFRQGKTIILEIMIDRREVTVYEEYKVYDFNGIVGSVGGSLGLFIGFSFLDAMLFLIQKGWEWLCYMKKDG